MIMNFCFIFRFFLGMMCFDVMKGSELDFMLESIKKKFEFF